jgi:hypothetical protein
MMEIKIDEVDIKVFDTIEKIERGKGCTRIRDVHIDGFSDAVVLRSISKLLGEGALLNISVDEVRILHRPNVWVDAEDPNNLDWGFPITPKTSDKGCYWITPKCDKPAYLKLEKTLLDAINAGKAKNEKVHSVIVGGYNYWANFSGGIARRPVPKA